MQSTLPEDLAITLMDAALLELKLLPDPWPKLSQDAQSEIIDRLRKQIVSVLTDAVRIIASDGRTTIAGDLESITIKDGAKAVVKFARAAENLHELYDVQGKPVLVVLADAKPYTVGLADVKGEQDQRAMQFADET